MQITFKMYKLWNNPCHWHWLLQVHIKVINVHQCTRAPNLKKKHKLEMWANAQRDGRPAEHRWRPLFNSAKFGWRSLLDCCAVMLLRCGSCKVVEVPQTPETILAASRPKFTILWRHVEEILLLNKFFSDCRYVPWLRRYSPTKLWDGAQMAIFCVLYFSESRAAHFRPAF